jgi:hypothetical protein
VHQVGFIYKIFNIPLETSIFYYHTKNATFNAANVTLSFKCTHYFKLVLFLLKTGTVLELIPNTTQHNTVTLTTVYYFVTDVSPSDKNNIHKSGTDETVLHIEPSSDFEETNYLYLNFTYGPNFIFVNAGLKYAIQYFILLRGLGF